MFSWRSTVRVTLRDTGRTMAEESTTPDLAERVRGLIAAANQRDFDAVLSFYAADAIWEAESLGTSFEGLAAIRGFVEDWIGAYTTLEFKLEEVVDLGNGLVFVVLGLTGRPAGSSRGTLVRRRSLLLVWVDGLIARATAPSSDIDDARAAAERLAESRG
jgi:ketosteroid isomerase-like protein